MRKSLQFLLVGILLIAACEPNIVPTSANPLRIVLLRATVRPGETLALALDGEIPVTYAIAWSAERGTITSSGTGLTVAYVAPDTAGQDVVRAVITGGKEPVNLEATVTVLSVNTETPATTTTATATATLTPTFTPSLTPTSAITPTDTATPTATATPNPSGIVITEVMVKPCGPDYTDKWNEYIELYNNSNQPIDVNGWWIADRVDGGAPDQLVSWSERNPDHNKIFKDTVITDSTIIPARGFAVVLSAIYQQGEQQYKTPYRFPDGTLILTSREGKRIGDDFGGLIGGRGNDFLVLYIGSSTFIRQVISTYGTPKNTDNLIEHLSDDYLDVIPFITEACQAVERKDAAGPDNQNNWRMITPGNPGEGNYP